MKKNLFEAEQIPLLAEEGNGNLMTANDV